MASFGNAMAGGGATMGPNLETIQTEALGFQTLNGDAKVRLTSAWSSPPASTSSLLTIASRKGLVAAAGPDQVIIATTESVRKAFEANKDGDSDIRAFEPRIKMPMSMRVSHISFTADESYLLLSAESGGGLAVYEVQSLLQGSTNAAFELSTNGESLRLLVPNPAPEKAELCAVVTNSGNLHVANLQSRSLSNALKDQVSCLSWSTKGKQLCAGRADGTVHQMTPEGELKAEIPKPSDAGNSHVSSVTWLENHVFLAIYTDTNQSPPASDYYFITRQPPSSFTFQKTQDPVEPLSAENPPHHTLLRLRDFPPDLQDVLIVTSTASPDLGLLTRAKSPLASDKPVDAVTNVFTTTELLDDTRRPTLPMTEDMDDSVPIGVGLDLSSTEKVYKPIPADEELEESPTPVPGLWVLTHEGLLCSWWVIYNASIRQGMAYSDMVAETASTAATVAPESNSTASAFSKPASTASPFGNPSTSAFGSNTAASGFGSTSAMGQNSSPWGSSAGGGNSSTTNTGGAAFGQSSFGGASATPAPSFGKPTALGFGQASQPGAKASPWGGSGSATTGSFGLSGFSSFSKNNDPPSPFSSFSAKQEGSSSQSSGGFAGFANKGGFGSVAANNDGGSIFASGNKDNKPSASPFGATSSMDTAFPPKTDDKPSGFGSSPFQLKSSFKANAEPQEQSDKPAAPSGSLFGSGFGNALSDAQSQPTVTTPAAKDEDMDTGEPAANTAQEASSTEETPKAKPSSLFPPTTSPESTTPTTTPGPSRFSFAQSSAPGSSLFGKPTSTSGIGGSFGSKPDDSKSDSIFAKKPEGTTASGSGDYFGSKPDGAKSDSIFAKKPEAPNSSGSGGIFGSKPGGSKPDSIFAKKPETPKVPNPFAPKADSQTKPNPFAPTSDAQKSSLFPPSSSSPRPNPFGNLLNQTPTASEDKENEPKIKTEEEEELPLPPDTTSKVTYPIGESSSSSTTSSAPSQPYGALTTASNQDSVKQASESSNRATTQANAPPSSISSKPPEKPKVAETGPSSFSFLKPAKPAAPDTASSDKAAQASRLKARRAQSKHLPPPSESTSSSSEPEPSDQGEPEDDGQSSEGSGVDVAKDLSPSTTGFTETPGFTPQGSFGGNTSTTPATANRDGQRSLFGEVGRNAPMFPQPRAPSPRSPSPIRGAIPTRVMRAEGSRSVSAPGMASQILGPRQSQSQQGHSAILGSQRHNDGEDPFLQQQRKQRARQEAEESQPLFDEDDDIQRILQSEVTGTLKLDEFVAHSNVAPPARDSIPAQVEAVCRDITSMIDTLGLNSRAVKDFVKGNTDMAKPNGRTPEDLEKPGDWVLCEVDELGRVVDEELYEDLEDGRVQDLDGKLGMCLDMAKDMHRLRAKQEDLKRIILGRMDPAQAEATRLLPLTTEQAAQQNDLRREFTNFSEQLAEAEEALTLLKTRMASMSSGTGKGRGNAPTLEAVMRTINKMTTMAEKRSGDVDVLETQLRKLQLGASSREGSPMRTPQGRRSIMFSPDATPSRSFRHSMTSSVGFGSPARATPPRKKLSGFTTEEKTDLMEKKARRQAVLGRLRESVEKKGVHVWSMEDME